jgi:O-antigen biosynthesis protein
VIKRLLQSGLHRVKHVWGTGTIWTAGEMRHWLQHPLVQTRVNRMITGGSETDRFQYFLKSRLDGRLPVDRALTLGCGSGELERGLSKYNFAKAHEGIDVSDDAIRKAGALAADQHLSHVSYRSEDLNRLHLQPHSYDVIFGVSSVHHVESLENLFAQIAAALKPGGYFFLDEYIGPSRFQWTDDQLRIMNEELNALPRELRRSVSEPGKYKPPVIRKTVEYMKAADPSEAVRSAEIVPLLSQYFDIREFKGYGGSLLHELLYDIAGNFTEKAPGSLDHLRRLFDLEDHLIALGTLAHDFAVIVATPH